MARKNEKPLAWRIGHGIGYRLGFIKGWLEAEGHIAPDRSEVSPDALTQFAATDIAGRPEDVSPAPRKDWSKLSAYITEVVPYSQTGKPPSQP